MCVCVRVVSFISFPPLNRPHAHTHTLWPEKLPAPHPFPPSSPLSLLTNYKLYVPCYTVGVCHSPLPHVPSPQPSRLFPSFHPFSLKKRQKISRFLSFSTKKIKKEKGNSSLPPTCVHPRPSQSNCGRVVPLPCGLRGFDFQIHFPLSSRDKKTRRRKPTVVGPRDKPPPPPPSLQSLVSTKD